MNHRRSDSRTARAITTVLGALLVASVPSAYGQSPDAGNQWPPDPKRRFWVDALSPQDFMRAYRQTGQAEAKRKEAAGQVAGAAWTRSGPLGNFPQRNYNGRMASIFVREHLAGYDVYAGASSGGLWVANGTDGVPQWTSLGDGLPNPAVKAITINPENIDDIIVATGDWSRYMGGGMFRTTDGGLTWNEVIMPAGVSPTAYFEIVRSPVHPNAMWACTSVGIIRSLNGGTTWTRMEDGLCTDLIMDPIDPGIQYATFIGKGTDGVDNGVYKTDDFWVNSRKIVDSDLPTGPLFERASLAICDGAEETLALLVETDSDLGGIFKSDDYGETWRRISPFSMTGFSQIFHAQAIAIRPGDPNHIFAGSVELWETRDGGGRWTLNAHKGHADITQLHFSPVTGRDTLWILNDGGIYKYTITEFLGTLAPWNGEGPTGLNCSQIHDFDAEREMQVIGLQDNGTLQSFDAGVSWNFFTGADGFAAEIIDSLEQRYWYADGFWSDPLPVIRIWRKPFGGSAQEATLPSGGWRERIFYDRVTDTVYTVGARALLSSPESGGIGFTQDIGLPNPAYDKHVYGSKLYGNELYVTYWDEPILTVRRYTGGTWTTATTGHLGNAHTVEQVVVSTENAGESWACLNGDANTDKLLHTTDFWHSWTDLTGILAPVKGVRGLAVTPMNSRQMFAGTDVGVFRSSNGGVTWTPFQEGLPTVMITDIYYVPDPARSGTDTLVVSTFGRGVYSRPIAGPPLTYVDPDHVGDEDGMFPHPYNTLGEGAADVPPGGTLAIRGRDYPITAPLLLNTPRMLMRSYDGAALIGG